MGITRVTGTMLVLAGLLAPAVPASAADSPIQGARLSGPTYYRGRCTPSGRALDASGRPATWYYRLTVRVYSDTLGPRPVAVRYQWWGAAANGRDLGHSDTRQTIMFPGEPDPGPVTIRSTTFAVAPVSVGRTINARVFYPGGVFYANHLNVSVNCV
ncbi:hypothetical protein AB0395_38520 [Streptosporangium sp. NPDC051023]|uniref:hypothetical protein n=1 Tax=Streptosporangium sp. NPDC051023 TaxID=3155410 RepID=UPI00344F8CDB